jgi:prolyl oligopeptidase
MSLSESLSHPLKEVFYGITVVDPYRFLEDRNTPRTEEWLRNQNRHFHAYFKQCTDLPEIEARVRAYLDVTVVDQPVKVEDRYIYRRRNQGEERGSIYLWDPATGQEQLLVSPPKQQCFASVGIHRVSENGHLLAYEIKEGGEDRKEIHFLDIRSGVVLSDVVPRGLARGLAFTPGGSGYYYVQEIDTAESEHRIQHHRFGQTGMDEIVFRVPKVRGSRLVLISSAAQLGAVWFHPSGERIAADFSVSSAADGQQWNTVFREKPVPYSPILCHDRILVLAKSESGDSVIEVSRDGDEVRPLVPARGVSIDQCVVTRDRLLVRYLDHGACTIETWDFKGNQLAPIKVPPCATISIHPVHTQNSDTFFYSYESYDCPPAIHEFSIQSHSSSLWHLKDLSHLHRRCTIHEAIFKSDGDTSVPVTLVSKGHDRLASQPAIMTSYGGFGMSMTPQFSVLITIMMELGAVFILPHIRGGGEFGNTWHEAGRKRNKQKAFDDFIAAAEWLYREGITTPEKLAIFGGSHSGLLVAAAMIQRPDLFAAVLCIAPLTDMVRYEQFDDAARWRSEFGTAEDPEDFQALYSYSPYHQVRNDTNYPATLFVSGDRDDRCNPAHARKMVAQLQEREAQRAPIILDYEELRGHSPVMPLSIRIQALTRRIAFLCRQLKIEVPKGGICETTCD